VGRSGAYQGGFLPVRSFAALDQVPEVRLQPLVRITRSYTRPGGGVAQICLVFGWEGDALPLVQAALWLPEELDSLVRPPLLLTNQAPGVWYPTPAPASGFVLMALFEFADYLAYPEILASLEGPVHLRLSWNGAERHLWFPGSHWRVDLPD
jgi:hypothetical protein